MKKEEIISGPRSFDPGKITASPGFQKMLGAFENHEEEVTLFDRVKKLEMNDMAMRVRVTELENELKELKKRIKTLGKREKALIKHLSRTKALLATVYEAFGMDMESLEKSINWKRKDKGPAKDPECHV